MVTAQGWDATRLVHLTAPLAAVLVRIVRVDPVKTVRADSERTGKVEGKEQKGEDSNLKEI